MSSFGEVVDVASTLFIGTGTALSLNVRFLEEDDTDTSVRETTLGPVTICDRSLLVFDVDGFDTIGDAGGDAGDDMGSLILLFFLPDPITSPHTLFLKVENVILIAAFEISHFAPLHFAPSMQANISLLQFVPREVEVPQH